MPTMCQALLSVSMNTRSGTSPRIGTSQPAKLGGYKSLGRQKSEIITQKAPEQFLPDPGTSSCLCPLILVLPPRGDVKRMKAERP